MDRKEQITAFINAIINNDNDAASAAFSPYVQDKSREILGSPSDKQDAETVKTVTEAVMQKEINDILQDSPVRIGTDDSVLVNGKRVGVVRNDPTDFSGPINFVEDGGKLTQDFSNTKELYDFLIDRYSKGGKK